MDKYQVGLISPKVLQVLRGYPKVFVISESEQTVRLSENLDSYESRSEALAGVLLDLKDRGGFVTLKGWRNEVKRYLYDHIIICYNHQYMYIIVFN